MNALLSFMLCLLGALEAISFFATARVLFPAAPLLDPPAFDLIRVAESEPPAFFLTTGFFATGLAGDAELSPGPV